MNNRNSLVILAIFTLITALTLPAMAQAGAGKGQGNRTAAGFAPCGAPCYGPGNGPGNGPGDGTGRMGFLNQIPEEQREAATTLWETHRDKMISLRDEFRAKNMEMDGVMASANPDNARLDALGQELSQLNANIFSERLNFRRSMKAQFGIDLPSRDFNHHAGRWGHSGRRWHGNNQAMPGGPGGFGYGPGMSPGGDRGFGPGNGPGNGQASGPGYGPGYGPENCPWVR